MPMQPAPNLRCSRCFCLNLCLKRTDQGILLSKAVPKAYLKEGGREALLLHRIQRLLSRLGEAVLARLYGSRHPHDARMHIAVALDGDAPILRHALLHWRLRREVADVAAQVKSGDRGVGTEVVYQTSRLSAC